MFTIGDILAHKLERIAREKGFKVEKPVYAYPPEYCDGCSSVLKDSEFFYDAKTKHGPWGWLCEDCFTQIGIGLGTGFGQKYRSKDNLKVEG